MSLLPVWVTAPTTALLLLGIVYVIVRVVRVEIEAWKNHE